MIYIVKNLFPIFTAMLAGLAIGWAWLAGSSLASPSPATIVIIALCEFWIAAILAGALILAPDKAGGWTMALGSAFIIWIGFVAPAMIVTLRVAGEGWPAVASICAHWLAVMLVQAALMKAIGLTPPPES
ncbi:MAG: hypothetical protein WA948_02690 [Pontixanthobacter sp.]